MKIPIVVDSREKCPFSFRDYEVTLTTAALPSGDYTLLGFESEVAVERKATDDLIACLGVNRERFVRELARLRGYQAAVVVVEGALSDLELGAYRSKMSPLSAVQSVVALTQRYRMPFHFAGDRRKAEFFTFNFLRHFANDAEARFAAVCRWRSDAE